MKLNAFVGALFLTAFLPYLCGPFPQYIYAHDVFIFLDGAWRVLHGQRPQVDFSTNLGPVMYLLTAGSVLLAKPAGHALSLLQTFVSLMAAAPVCYLSFRRLPQVPAMLVSILLLLVAAAPYNTGEMPILLTSGMIYNRLGYALLGVVLIEATQRVKAGAAVGTEELLGGGITGLVCAILLFTKITYFLVAVLLIFLLLPYRPQIRERFLGMLGAGLAFTVPMLWYVRFNVAAIVREQQMSAGAKVVDFKSSAWIGMDALPAALLLLVIALLFWQVTAPGSLFGERAWTRPWAVIITLGASFGLIITNHQISGQPLTAVICILLGCELIDLRRGGDAGGSSTALRGILLLGLLTSSVVQLIPSILAFTYADLRSAIAWKGSVEEVSLAAPAVSDIRIKETPEFFDVNKHAQEMNYGTFVNDGLALLEKNSSPRESVVSLDFSNPFSFSLQRPPPAEGILCLQAGVTFGYAHNLPPDRMFGNAPLVMLPKIFSDDSIARPVHWLYGETLRTKFRLVSESAYWELYRRL